MQLLIQIFTSRNQGKIEKDKRLSKCNYGSRKNYSIKLAVLEKRLICNHSKIKCEETAYNLTDLKAYYDRELLEIISIVEESTGIEREPVKLFVKILPKMQYFMSTGFGMSN